MWWLPFVVAHAHEPGLSRLALAEGELTLSVASADGVEAAALLSGARVSRAGQPCRLGPPVQVAAEPGPKGHDGTEARASLDCPASGPTTLEATWFERLPPGHRTLVEQDGLPVAWLDAGHATLELQGGAAKSAWSVALDYLALGVEHILTGWDHLLFLAGLLLGTRTLKEALGVVTGFTLAHSVTLSAAALGVVTAPAWLVEPVIALTVVLVGLENLRPGPPLRRVALTSVLGLVHGLGFAGLLGELGLPKDQLLPALLAFNGGVELGQFLVVMLVVPALLRLRSLEGWRGPGVRYASVVVSLVGLFWFVERIVGNLG